MFRIVATRGADESATSEASEKSEASEAYKILADVPLDRLPALLTEKGTHVWVDLTEPCGEVERSIVRDVFKFHQLAIEDCFESREHPKIDEYDSYVYLITHGLHATSTAESAEVVELDAFVGANYLVTHHIRSSRSVAAVTEMVLKSGLPLRRSPMVVLHALLDRQVDGFEEQLDGVEERITQLEDAVFARPSNSHIASLLAVKRNILKLRRWMSKQREVVLRLGRQEFKLVKPQEAMLFRDVHDHLVRINDLLENFREMLTSIQEAYLSVTSNRLNEIMKFLTLFTAVLMPLTVITGIYGMNFEHMPELRERLGYPAVLGAMALVSGSVLIYFWRRGWLGRPPPLDPLGAITDAGGRTGSDARVPGDGGPAAESLAVAPPAAP
jgi:magnesium transporter